MPGEVTLGPEAERWSADHTLGFSFPQNHQRPHNPAPRDANPIPPPKPQAVKITITSRVGWSRHMARADSRTRNPAGPYPMTVTDPWRSSHRPPVVVNGQRRRIRTDDMAGCIAAVCWRSWLPRIIVIMGGGERAGGYTGRLGGRHVAPLTREMPSEGGRLRFHVPELLAGSDYLGMLEGRLGEHSRSGK